MNPSTINRLGNVSTGNSQAGMVYSTDGVCFTICAGTHGYAMGYIMEFPICVAMRGRYNENGMIKQNLEPRFDGYTNTLTSVQKDNYIIEVKNQTK